MQDYCFHIHTPRCGHADENMWEDYTAKLFYEAGFKTIAFTDHNPWKTFLDDKPNHAMRWNQKEEYLESVKQLAKEYEGKMKIVAGFECEYIPQLSDEMAVLRKDSELVILGQHFTCGEDGQYISMHKKGFVPNDYELDFYASCLENACKNKFADILVHPDLYMYHKTEFGKKEEEIAHKICQTAEKYDIPVEINLCVPSKSYLLIPCEITYPCRGFWNIAKDYKLNTIFGLDFHGHFDPIHMGEIMDKTCKLIGDDVISKLHICTSEEINKKLGITKQ